MSRLNLALDELRNALRAAREVAEAANRDAVSADDDGERERLVKLAERYSAIVTRLERTLLDRTRNRKRVRAAIL